MTFGVLLLTDISYIRHTDHLTWFDLQRATVNLNVEPFGRGVAEVFQHAVHGLRHVVRHRLVQLHLAVYDNAAVPEVEDFQLLESRQIGLEIRKKLREGKHTLAEGGRWFLPADELFVCSRKTCVSAQM